MYSATGMPEICLRAVVNRAKPYRCLPASSCWTVGASTGPAPRPRLSSSIDLPFGEGKSAAEAVGWERDSLEPSPPELPHADRHRTSAASGKRTYTGRGIGAKAYGTA